MLASLASFGDDACVAPSTKSDPLAEHWRRLTLQPGAPECVIKEAHRFHIRRVHPDLGGSDDAAKQVNIAMDKLLGRGAPANEYVSQNYDRAPFFVLGIAPSAERSLAERVGRALTAELEALPRLASRVAWAAANFGADAPAIPQPRRRQPKPTPPPPSRPWMPSIRPAPPIGPPEGLAHVDFGAVTWSSDAEMVVRLTWPRRAPAHLSAEAGAPFDVTLHESRTQPGRVALKLTIDWDAPELNAAARSAQRFDSTLTVRWDKEGAAVTRVSATIGRESKLAVGPRELDLGTVGLRERVQAELTVRAIAPANVTIESSSWLTCSHAGALRLDAATPVVLPFTVNWSPILERGAASIAARRSLRPTGNIRLRWDAGEIVVPVEMLVEI